MSKGILTRREFLAGTAISAGLLGGMFLEGIPAEIFAAEIDKRYDIKAGTWIPSCCNMCGGQTGIMCQVVDGKLVRIKPNNNNPIGFSNISDDFFENCPKEGAVMCPKGNSGIMTLYDPDRLAKPVRRTNPEKGLGVDPKWKEISWDEAYKEIVDRFKKLRDAGEAHKLIWFSEDHSFTHIQGDFCQLYGTPNYSQHSNLCDVSRKASFKATIGDERPLTDAIQSKYILFFGWNPLGATKFSHLPRIITRGIERGAKLVVVDPYFSETANKADEWIPIRPGTDGAMALAMCHVIIKENLYDKEFVDKWTYGFKEFSEYVKDKTPKWAADITSVPVLTIERIAREFAATKPAVLDTWSGGHHSNSVHGGAAIACLAGLTGGYDRLGTLILPDAKGNKHMHIHASEPKEPRFAGDDELYPMFHKSGVYCEQFKQLATGKPKNYMPKIGMIIFQNPMMSVPGTETIAEALKKLEFLVVNDIFLSETAQFADIVLPGTTYLERYDLNTHWVTWPVLGLRQPVVKPIFGQPTEYEFVIELGRRLGLKDEEGHDFFQVAPMSGEKIDDKTKWYEDYLSNELKNGEPKMTLEELKKLPGATWVNKKGTKYEKYKGEIPPDKMEKAVVVKKKLRDIEIAQIYEKPKKAGEKPKKRMGTVINGKPVRGFYTPTGKFEFSLTALDGKKDAEGNPCDTLPVFKPRDWQPDNEYPLYLVNWKEASHTHTRTQNNRWLLEIKPNNPLIINSRAADKLGIKTGDEVWVESKYGKVKGTVKVVEGIHPEVVGWQHGFGHWAQGDMAKGRGTSDSPLRPTRADSISGQSLNKQCCVKVYKA